MSHRISPRPLRALAAVTALALSAIAIAAQDSPTTRPAANAPVTAAPRAASQTAVQLSFGVPDVLKLSQANISEDTIIAYVQASGRSYGGMSASEIVYLHEQGVSDNVVNAMLNQGNQLTAAAAAAQTAPPASVTQATTDANTTPRAAQSPQAYGPTPVTPAQPAPAPTVYAPNAPPVVDYGYYPGYGYSGYYYPPVSFSFGFGGGYRGGYYYGGGYHGGYHGSGGYHGGGSHGGGGAHR